MYDPELATSPSYWWRWLWFFKSEIFHAIWGLFAFFIGLYLVSRAVWILAAFF